MGFLGEVNLRGSVRVTQFNSAGPGGANADLFTPVLPVNAISYFVAYIVPVNEGVLSISRTVGGTSTAEKLNSGIALEAGAAYMFTFAAVRGQAITLRYSVDTGILCLIVVEQTGTAG